MRPGPHSHSRVMSQEQHGLRFSGPASLLPCSEGVPRPLGVLGLGCGDLFCAGRHWVHPDRTYGGRRTRCSAAPRRSACFVLLSLPQPGMAFCDGVKANPFWLDPPLKQRAVHMPPLCCMRHCLFLSYDKGSEACN